jgi:hypothetical protein
MLDFRLFKQVLDACDACVAELETQPLAARISKIYLFGEAIKGVIHQTLQSTEGRISCGLTFDMSGGAKGAKRPL